MWARGAAIRPVPAFAVVSRSVLAEVERALGVQVEDGEDDGLGAAGAQEASPVLAGHDFMLVADGGLDALLPGRVGQEGGDDTHVRRRSGGGE